MFNLSLPTPVELAFEPVNLCNAKCFCCPYTILEKDKEYRGKRMSEEKITTLITQFAEGIKKFKVSNLQASVQPWRYSDPLVCKDLELIFELCRQHNLRIQLTTNAVSFSEKKCDLIMKYIENIGSIHISIIGFNQQEIREYMDLDWGMTKARLIMVRDKYPEISEKMVIGIKSKDQNPDKSSTPPIRMYLRVNPLTLGLVKVKKNWLENRLAYNKFTDDDLDFKISEKKFVKGCSMGLGKILRRLEIMVDGTAVLCCDDATAQTNFGNIFDLGVAGVWENLKGYHEVVYSKKFSEKKKNMICNTCSRARFDWSRKLDLGIRQQNNKYIQS